MLVDYLNYYLIFIIFLSILISLIVIKSKSRSLKTIIPLIMALMFLPAVIGYFYFINFASIPEATVPDLTGMPLEDARAKLEELKLKGRLSGSVFDMKQPEGNVVSQRPEGGRRVKVGRMINLITSSGKRKVFVPNILGRPAPQAEAVLSAEGLLLGQKSENYAPELDPNIILEQDPMPGDEVDVGSSVSIKVSSAKVPVEVVEVKDEEEDKEKDEDEEKGWWFRLW
jgi:serine/threonine-protein kinase